MTDEDDIDFDEWLATRPECVQKLAKEFPIGDIFIHDDILYHIIGYTEDDQLILSPVSPYVDYEKALANKKYFCAEHFRNALKDPIQ